VPLPDSTDWLGFSRRAAGAARDAVNAYATTAERGVETGRGEGGDTAYVIDRAAEDAIFAEIEGLGVPVTAVSEERGEVEVDGGSDTRVVIDPVDGSLNAKRGLPFACVSIAIASGPRMGDVEMGWVAELDPRISAGDEPRPGRDWWAVKGEGAFRDGEPLPRLRPGPLEVLGLETARPELVAAAASAIEAVQARRIRALGSVAMTLCLVAAGQLDAMLSLRPIRSVDAAAAQLLVTEAGGAVAFPAADDLSLEMRSPVLAARDKELLEHLRTTFSLGRRAAVSRRDGGL
jgi:myo-inositol-1(or 4)-monophosphatase